MKTEHIILISSILITVMLLLLLVKREKLLEAQVSYLFMQVLTWLFGAVVVEERLIQYPADFFHYAQRTSFTFEYFIFPSVSAIFNVRFPRKRKWYIKALYIVGIPGIITAAEATIERYTKVIDYIDWRWEYSLASMTATLLISYWYYRWFFSKVKEIR